jgi:hypothetical protein
MRRISSVTCGWPSWACEHNSGLNFCALAEEMRMLARNEPRERLLQARLSSLKASLCARTTSTHDYIQHTP